MSESGKGREGAESSHILRLLATKKTEVHLEYGLEESHVRAVIQPDLVLPDVDNEDLRGSKREQCRFALEILCLDEY